MRDGGLAQIFFGLGDRACVGLIHENEIAERLANQRGHHAIRFGESLGDNRFQRAQRLQHVDILRALAGIQKSNFGRRTMTAEDALRA